MKRTSWSKWVLSAAVGASLAGGTIWAQPLPKPAEPAVIVLREKGMADRQCLVERTQTEADGAVVHDVRDLATGSHFQVRDGRNSRMQIIARISGPDAVRLAIETPPGGKPPVTPVVVRQATKQDRWPTPAELASAPSIGSASGSSPARTVVYRKPAGDSSPAVVTSLPADSVAQQIHYLKEALGPAQREMAAMNLAISDGRKSPEVIEALIHAMQTDPAPSVRCCLVRCLYRLSAEVPTLVPVIAKMQNDADDEVQRAAQLAIQQLSSAPPRR